MLNLFKTYFFNLLNRYIFDELTEEITFYLLKKNFLNQSNKIMNFLYPDIEEIKFTISNY